MHTRNSLRLVVASFAGDAAGLRDRIAQIAPGIGEVVACEVPEALREVVGFDHFDALILEWQGGRNALEPIARAVRDCPLTPVLVVSNQRDSAASERMLRLGVQDYLVKRQTRGRDLIRAIHHAIERKRLETRLKTTLGDLGEANARLRSMVLKDPLTGALNRRAFRAVAGQMLARAERHRRRLALLYCDLDTLIARADAGMYRAKQGAGIVCDREMGASVV